MREIAHNWISPVRIKVNASQIAVATAGAAQSEDRSAKQKTSFFDTIGRFCRSIPGPPPAPFCDIFFAGLPSCSSAEYDIFSKTN